MFIYGTLKIVLSETTEPRVFIWHVASSSRHPKFVENYGPVYGRIADRLNVFRL